jgi:hypothetical protein
MKKNTLKIRWAFAVMTLVLTLTSCNFLTTSVNQVRTDSQTVEIKSATSARIQIEIASGELTVEGGGGSLMDADFQYDVDRWKPEVQYSENGAQGELIVSQPRVVGSGGTINIWTLLLKNDIPIDLSINIAAGDSELNLNDLELTTLGIENGSGTTNIDLSGNWDHDVNATIRQNFGNLTVKLPAEMGVSIEMDIGAVNVNANSLTVNENGYVNQIYGIAPHTLTLKLKAGSGSVTLVVPEQ